MIRQTIFSILVFGATLTAAHAGVYEDAVKGVMDNNPVVFSDAMQKGLDPNTQLTGTGDPLLTQAIKNNSGKIIDILLANPKTDIDRRNSVNETPLMIAIYLKNNKVAHALINKGAKVENKYNWAPLHYAATVGNREMIKTLLEKGADVNARTRRGYTPLYMAARDADYQTVKMLLDAGARKDFCSNDALAPRDIAVQRRNSQEVIDALEYDHCR